MRSLLRTDFGRFQVFLTGRGIKGTRIGPHGIPNIIFLHCLISRFQYTEQTSYKRIDTVKDIDDVLLSAPSHKAGEATLCRQNPEILIS